MNPTGRTFAPPDPAAGEESAHHPTHDAEHVREAAARARVGDA
ncbi:hypothetical protein EHYA_02812 [Embleya hyalina]|uniref:Uncharacterized protein n=1 Tax=Embleya hyalina TaxID=516124 RepID=A0A401YKL2_9ACTN|nr:hypothetical protein EHYA_02812 [Embleya hyalina]